MTTIEYIRKPQTNRVTDLNIAEKMGLFAFSHTEQCQALYKLMENMVIEARDDAMAVDPANEKEQKSKMDLAHAMGLYYTRIRKSIESTANEHIGELQRIANEEVLRDREQIEQIILDQTVNPLVTGRPEFPNT
jgi:hypothetical protein